MPLLDHFHPPVSARKSWEGFHSTWAVTLMQHLNTMLPPPYEAEPQIHLGSRIEVDVATLEPEENGTYVNSRPSDGGIATLPQAYVAPAPTLTGEVEFGDPDSFEVLIYREAERWRLAAALEIVSPANKDRDQTRAAFVRKCEQYLAAGASVIVIDLVTIRSANLHEEFVNQCHLPEGYRWESPTGLSAISYRAVRSAKSAKVRLEVWPHELTLGAELPTLPLWLAPDLVVPLEFEASYRAACRSLKLAA